jgi:hypothetical protein
MVVSKQQQSDSTCSPPLHTGLVVVLQHGGWVCSCSPCGSSLSKVVIAAFSSLVSSLVPLYWYRNGINKRTLHALLGVSAGILFALATIDLIPEGIAVSSVNQRTVLKKQQAHRVKEHVHEAHSGRSLHGSTEDADTPAPTDGEHDLHSQARQGE